MLRWHFDDLTQEDTGFSSQQESREGGREGGGRETETHRDGDTDRQTDSKNQTDRQTVRQTELCIQDREDTGSDPTPTLSWSEKPGSWSGSGQGR